MEGVSAAAVHKNSTLTGSGATGAPFVSGVVAVEMVKGVRIRIYHKDCGQYTQLRRKPPRNNVRCPKCGKRASIWVFESELEIDKDYIGAWWPTMPLEKMGPGLRALLEQERVRKR